MKQLHLKNVECHKLFSVKANGICLNDSIYCFENVSQSPRSAIAVCSQNYFYNGLFNQKPIKAKEFVCVGVFVSINAIIRACHFSLLVFDLRHTSVPKLVSKWNNGNKITRYYVSTIV